MIIRVIQGVSLGFFLSLVFGLLFGIVGFTTSAISLILLQIITYLPAGYLAGKYEKHSFLSAGLAGFSLALVNLLFSAGVVGATL